MAQLDQALLESRESGLWLVNFFNGRLLSAEDMRREQHARDLVDGRLGLAVGEGVVRGLEVSTKDAQRLILGASAGHALNRQGRTLTLESDVELELSLPPAPPATGGRFDRCGPESGLAAAPGPGAYLLTLYPAEEAKERAEVSGLGNAVAHCNVRFVARGVQFRLIPLAAALAGAGAAPDARRLQNWLAYHCFGVGDEHPARRLLDVGSGANAFGGDGADYGLLARLRPGVLTDCDVPLAVLHVRPGQGLDFVDGWAVRRRPHRPHWPGRWHALLGERRRAESEAMLLQFQDQVAGMLSSAVNLRTSVASNHFAFLPPVGLLPVGGNRFDARRFLSEGVGADGEIDAVELRQVVQHALALEPIDVRRWIDDGHPLIRRYTLRGVGQYVLFVRDDRRPATPTAPPEAPPETPPEARPPKAPAKRGRFVVRLIGPAGHYLGGGRARVWAQDMRGHQYHAQHAETPWRHDDLSSTFVLGSRRAKEAAAVDAILTHLGEYPVVDVAHDRAAIVAGGFGALLPTYVIENVPPGSYYLKAQVPTYFVASEATTIAEGQEVTVALRLRPIHVAPEPGWHGCHELDHPFVDRGGFSYRGICVPDLKYVIDWVRDGPMPDPSIFDPRPEHLPILDQLLEDVLVRDPSAPITPHAARLVVAAGHRPGVVSRDPYAYLVTEDGKGIPVILTAADRALPGPVATSTSGVRELSQGAYASALTGTSLQRMDTFAGAWATLVADTLGVSTTVATSLIRDVDAAAKDAKKLRTYYPGLGSDDAATLAAAGFDSDAALANASVDAVREALGLDEVTGFVERLVQHARSFVPTSAWSLSDPGNLEALGVSAGVVERAAVLGIDSLGAMQGVLERGSDAAVDLLQITPTQFEHLSERVPERLEVARVTSWTEPSFDLVDGLDAAKTAFLVESDITSVRMFADTPPSEVATILGVSDEAATTLVTNAITTVLAQGGAFDAAAAAKIVSDTGVKRLSDLGAVVAPAGEDWADRQGTVRAVGSLASSTFGRFR